MKPAWVFIRHGESVANATGVLAGHTDSPLTQVGVAQAETLREQLSTLTVDHVWCSDLKRASHTARAVFPHHPIRTDMRLRERAWGAWEGVERSELLSQGVSLIDPDLVPPRGETHQDVRERARAVLSDTTSGTIAIVTHGGWIRAALSWIDQTETAGSLTLRIPNCGVQIRARTFPEIP